MLRSMLFCPANNPKMLASAHLFGADGVIFDLEDAIAYKEKDAARDLLCEALKFINYGDCKIFARINPLYTEFAKEDIKQLVKHKIKYIRLPMTEDEEDIKELDKLITYYEKEFGIDIGEVKIQAAIETPKGVLNSAKIALASDRMVAISFGAEDYTNCLGIKRLKDFDQLIFARSQIVLSASMAKIDSIDTVFSDLEDEEGFEKEVIHSKNLGFSGKSCLNPSQVEKVNKLFTPNLKEAENAKFIIETFEEAEKKGMGVLTINGKMVDKPIIDKARKVLDLAKGGGII